MAKTKEKLGKVVKNYKGYNIRIELKDVKITKKNRLGQEKVVETRRCNNGTYGIYAGKKKISDGHKSINEAISLIN
jgi:hypothetical protein